MDYVYSIDEIIKILRKKNDRSSKELIEKVTNVALFFCYIFVPPEI